MKEYSFDTTAIHGDGGNDQFGSLVTPIYNTSTFIFDSTAQGAARFALEDADDLIDDLRQALELV